MMPIPRRASAPVRALILAQLLAACAPGLALPAADPAWPRMAGDGPYTIAIPAALRPVAPEGVGHSRYSAWRSPEMYVRVFYDYQGGGFISYPGAEFGRLRVAGRSGTWTRYVHTEEPTEFPHIFSAHFPNVGGEGIWERAGVTFTAGCRTAAACEIAPAIVGSIRWTR
jgi:hypothetical protein